MSLTSSDHVILSWASNSFVLFFFQFKYLSGKEFNHFKYWFSDNTVTRGSSLNRIKKITCFKLYWRKVYRRSLSFSFSFSYFLLPLLYPFSLFRQKTPVYFPQIQFETGYFFNPVQETSTRDYRWQPSFFLLGKILK